MNKHALLELYERIISEEPTNGKWDQKVNDENVQVFINMKGSEVSKDFPLIKAVLYFEAGTRISRIMRAIHNG